MSKPLNHLTDEEIEDALPNRPITGMRDIQYLYGTLYEFQLMEDFDVDEKFGDEVLPFLTPYESADMVVNQDGDDETGEEGVIALRVDLTDDIPSLEDIVIRQYTRDMIPSLAHTRSDGNRDKDHSITHQAGKDSKVSKIGRYLSGRITEWPLDDDIREYAEEYASDDEQEFLDVLADFGSSDWVDQEIKKLAKEKLTGEYSSLVTVQFKTETGGEWKWPGSFDALNNAMKHRKMKKYTEKTIDKASRSASSGTGIDIVTGEEETLVGTSSDPMNYYLPKQRGRHPGGNIQDSWLGYPVSADTAVKIQNSSVYSDVLYRSQYGSRVYMMPYYTGEPTAAKVRGIYDLLEDIRKTGENDIDRIYSQMDFSVDGDFRLYCSFVLYQQDTRFDVLGEVREGTENPVVDVADAHDSLLESALFNTSKESSGGLPAIQAEDPEDFMESWLLQLPEEDSRLHKTIGTGNYWYSTFPNEEHPIDDARMEAYRKCLSGESVSVPFMMRNYVSRLLERETEADDLGFSMLVTAQFLQLKAIAKCGLLKNDGSGNSYITDECKLKDAFMNDESLNRVEKLREFIDSIPELRENSHLKGITLLGMVVGRISNYQSNSNDVSRTLKDQYPVSHMTPHRAQEAYAETVDRSSVYASADDIGSFLYGDLHKELADAMVESPKSWDVDKNTLKFYYALGLSYGLTDYSSKTVNDEDN